MLEKEIQMATHN